jgi:pSer/pThr/pTyr-binding forkhead associated (FHA) protein
MPKLLLQFGGAVIKEIPITKHELTVGRRPDNDIVIDNPTVSGHHCKITMMGDLFFVEDLNSSNGVFVNAQKVDRLGLKNNDVISIAKHALKFIDERQQQEPVLEPAPALASNANPDATMMISPEKQREIAAASIAAVQRKPAVVRVVKGIVDQAEYELKSSSMYIGKSARVQIRIKGTGIFGSAPESAAMIANRPEGYFIVPVKEGYPKLNGRALRQKALLRDGDVIEVGGTTLQFEENQRN